jgi:MFS family permease
VLVVIPFRMVVKDPSGMIAVAHAPALGVFRRLAAQPVFWLLAFGAGTSSLCGYGFMFWTPALLQRSFGLSMMETGQFIGGQFLIAGTAGIMLGGVLGDRLGRGDRAGYARVPAVAYLLCAPAFAVAFSMTGTAAAFALLLVPTLLSNVWLGPVIAAIQHLVPREERATASACFLLVNNGVGLGFGSLIIGRLSDGLTPRLGDEALRQAMTWSTVSYLVAGTLMLVAAPLLRKAWRE